MVGGAVISLVMVIGVGYYQFGCRAARPIEIVKTKVIHGSDATIVEGILDFVKSKGIKVASEGFKPSWGAEQVSDSEWVVSYVFEVGRESHWLSWNVNTRTGSMRARDAFARELLIGK